MSRVEVLCTTMHQTGFDKYFEMNLQTNAVIANQSDGNSYEEQTLGGNCVRLITTDTKGLSRNRNIALSFSSGEFLMFADDDMRFVDGYEKIVINEFSRHPEAKAIKFFVESSRDGRQVGYKCPDRFKKATRRNTSSSGVVGLAMRGETLKRYNLHFNELFGAGTDNYCGEDTIFLQDILNNKIPFYISPVKISDIHQGESSWFKGHNEKFFTVAGKVFHTTYPKLCYLLAVRSAYRFSKRSSCDLKFRKILSCYLKGIRSDKKGE